MTPPRPITRLRGWLRRILDRERPPHPGGPLRRVTGLLIVGLGLAGLVAHVRLLAQNGVADGAVFDSTIWHQVGTLLIGLLMVAVRDPQAWINFGLYAIGIGVSGLTISMFLGSAGVLPPTAELSNPGVFDSYFLAISLAGLSIVATRNIPGIATLAQGTLLGISSAFFLEPAATGAVVLEVAGGSNPDRGSALATILVSGLGLVSTVLNSRFWLTVRRALPALGVGIAVGSFTGLATHGLVGSPPMAGGLGLAQGLLATIGTLLATRRTADTLADPLSGPGVGSTASVDAPAAWPAPSRPTAGQASGAGSRGAPSETMSGPIGGIELGPDALLEGDVLLDVVQIVLSRPLGVVRQLARSIHADLETSHPDLAHRQALELAEASRFLAQRLDGLHALGMPDGARLRPARLSLGRLLREAAFLERLEGQEAVRLDLEEANVESDRVILSLAIGMAFDRAAASLLDAGADTPLEVMSRLIDDRIEVTIGGAVPDDPLENARDRIIDTLVGRILLQLGGSYQADDLASGARVRHLGLRTIPAPMR